MINPYINSNYKLEKLLDQYKTYGQIILGVDFDFTLFDSSTTYEDGEFYEDILSLVLEAQNSGACTMCLWTASGDIEAVKAMTAKVGIEWDYINESPLIWKDTYTRKPHFNLLLDDASGLREAVKLLQLFLKTIKANK